MEELLLRRFIELDREEVQIMFHLQDIRKSKVWQEAHETGIEEGIEKGIEKGMTLAQCDMVQKCVANGMSIGEIAALMGISTKEVRRLSKKCEK